MNTIPMISRKEMIDDFVKEIETIMDLCGYKNGNYGAGGDAFHNFRNTSQRVEGNIEPNSMYKVLHTYRDKHDCALAKNKFDDPEFIERNRDNIIYCLIAISMKRAMERQADK